MTLLAPLYTVTDGVSLFWQDVRAIRKVSVAIVAALGGALALLAGKPGPVMDVQQLAKAVAHEDDHVTAGELTAWIRDRKPGLRVIDLRTPAEFAQYHLPHAENLSIEAVTTAPFRPSETIVLISDAGGHVRGGWTVRELLLALPDIPASIDRNVDPFADAGAVVLHVGAEAVGAADSFEQQARVETIVIRLRAGHIDDVARDGRVVASVAVITAVHGHRFGRPLTARRLVGNVRGNHCREEVVFAVTIIADGRRLSENLTGRRPVSNRR